MAGDRKSTMAELATAARRPTELLALLRFRARGKAAIATAMGGMDDRWRWCYRILGQVSRSFALVIMELEAELRDPVAIFYLVLRALDTVEDDTAVAASVRRSLCIGFHEKLVPEAGGWTTDGFGKGAEKELLERFDTVHSCFSGLKPEYQRVIADITREMGFGMAEHMDETACVTVADYDRYCHYVAGLVGLGLTRMFACSGLESPALADPQRDHLANSMGLFLQKTNIIRDYLEDLNDGRTFWPEEIWSVHADRLGAFAAPEQRKAALSCLNAMVTDALRHVPDCLEYMSAIRSPSVFHFVAIPQVMAMATLAEVYANPAVFSGVVKLRRGKTAVLISRATSVDLVHELFFQSAVGMRAACAPADPSVEETRSALERIIRRTLPHVPATPDLTVPNRLSIVAFVTLSSYLLRRRAEHNDGTGFSWRRGGIPEPLDMLAAGALFLVMMWMFSFFGLQFVTAGLRPRTARPAGGGRAGGGGGGARLAAAASPMPAAHAGRLQPAPAGEAVMGARGTGDGVAPAAAAPVSGGGTA
ncbi:hypothetical protein I4F81_007468 [Pyropia yezoensis]|uniref:Uncharacterized protein n=1 Tax=Pyropia yezoensis TaxID=2788 RepID=A0ACC3C441_PYRYE|nr:hypothetical protein I4F81_007468 [Neopyropia yezoensis]